jgi:phosphatidate phosphatase PAH1
VSKNNDQQCVLIDIDGTLLHHNENLHLMMTKEPRILPGVIEKLLEWRSRGFYIIITTARPEGVRTITESQLSNMGIFYNQLVMGLPTGPRTVINDIKPDGTLTANSVNLKRNTGLEGVVL